MTLAIRTDKPEAEIYLLKNGEVIDQIIWQAHRQLADTIHHKMELLLDNNNLKYSDISDLITYTGPGSFTGLRIGITVFNTLAYANSIPIVGANTDDWLKTGAQMLKKGQNHKIVMPFYGAEANISSPKK
jgi:tRNA threonylcarbamoyl adenosine modification protein YeaZ